jgi:Fe-S-cluster containining protein
MTLESAKVAGELSELCRSCGACCDGTLFHRARLMPDEVEPAKRNGLRVIQDKGFEQPCPQLENKSCKIYESRPSVCQSFRCKLFARHRDEGGPIEARLRVVRRFRGVLQKLERYGFERGSNGEVRFSAEGPDAAAAMDAFQEVMQLMEDDFAREQRSDGPNS